VKNVKSPPTECSKQRRCIYKLVPSQTVLLSHFDDRFVPAILLIDLDSDPCRDLISGQSAVHAINILYGSNEPQQSSSSSSQVFI